ncbi:hypothetical protein [Lignipirellula cremea]|uniref:Uncharacterized protein n=1 Tax=Lignipirellula cremea TaxID=2528010 RepID=A0A518DKU3_9BACT|nr:hypothetical protein [Lignipirellula cremea]QDU92462.1 hypothetical protein Pla8534_02100 [Lignipirellula cremea]
MINNRVFRTQADYLFLIVRMPIGWKPTRLEETPDHDEVLSQHFVASYAEAYDDLVRCNRLAMEQGLDEWAVIQAPGGEL